MGPARRNARLLAVGSILHFAQPGDVIWGAGVNGKQIPQLSFPTEIEVRAVRGPLTREVLMRRGVDVPDVYGDPGLLISRYWEDPVVPERELTVVPNLNDLADYERMSDVVSPLESIETVISAIRGSRFVVGSSLHAIVVAESFGVPCRLLRSKQEPQFKYEDYFLGTGRDGVTLARSVSHALALGPEDPPRWSDDDLLAAFPACLWSPA